MFKALRLFLKQHLLILVLFQVALCFIIPRAEPGQYLFTFLFIKFFEYGALLAYFKLYANAQFYLYMNLGVKPNFLIGTVFAIDSLLSLFLIFLIK